MIARAVRFYYWVGGVVVVVAGNCEGVWIWEGVFTINHNLSNGKH
jgi:hypothetical protein